MAGFEVVVRPVVFPDIRPRAKQSLPPPDDPTKGFCEIKSHGNVVVTLSYSFTASASMSKPTETERRFDEVRVYQKDDNGKINRKNFVDVEVANRIKMNMGKFKGFTGDDLVKTREGRGYTGDDIVPYYYQRAKEKDNIEIRKRDRIRKKDQEDQ